VQAAGEALRHTCSEKALWAPDAVFLQELPERKFKKMERKSRRTQIYQESE
jgi:hypothetical protein